MNRGGIKVVKGNDGRGARRRLLKQWLLLIILVVVVAVVVIPTMILLPSSLLWKQKRNAYVFYATTSDYACGAFVAIASLQETGTQSSTIDFVLLTYGEASKDLSIKEQAKKMNVKIKDVKHLKTYGIGSNPYYMNVMVKLRVFQLYDEYHRIIFVESDMIIKENLDHLFTLPETITIAAPQVMIGDAGDHQGYFGSYLMVIKPSKTMWKRIMSYYDDDENNNLLKQNVYDMDLLNMEFMEDVYLLPGLYGMLTADWEYKENISFENKSQEWYNQLLGTTTTTTTMTSDEIFSKTKVLHFSPDKPMSIRNIEDVKRNKPDADPRYYATFERFFTLASYVCPVDYETVKTTKNTLYSYKDRNKGKYQPSSSYSDYFYS